MKIILSTTRIFFWKVPSNRSSIETLVIVIIINSSMFYYQFNTHLIMGYTFVFVDGHYCSIIHRQETQKFKRSHTTLFNILKISKVFHIAIANWDHKLLKWNMVLVDYIGIFFYISQYFWQMTVSLWFLLILLKKISKTTMIIDGPSSLFIRSELS